MSAFPSAALSIHSEQPDFVGQYGKALALKGMMQNQQLQGQQMQENEVALQMKQQQLKDTQTIQGIMPNHVIKDANGQVQGYDWSGLASDAASKNVSLPTLQSVQDGATKMTEQALKMSADQRAERLASIDELFPHVEAVRAVKDPAQRLQMQQQLAPQVHQVATKIGINPDQLQAQLAQPMTDDVLNEFEARLGMGKQVLSQAEKEADVKLKTAEASSKGFSIPVSKDIAESIGKPELAGQSLPLEVVTKLKTISEGTGDSGKYIANYLRSHNLPNNPDNWMQAFGAFTKETKTDPGVARAMAMVLNRMYDVVGDNGQAVKKSGGTLLNAEQSGTPLQSATLSPTVQGNLSAGKEAVKGVPVIQTALHHLDQMDQATNALSTMNVKALNSIANAYGVQVGNEPLATYRGIQQIIRGDILAASSAVGAKNENEEKAIDALTDPANPPRAIRASVASVRQLMKDRLKAKGEVFNQAAKGDNYFTPQTGGAQSTTKAPAGATHTGKGSDGKEYYLDASGKVLGPTGN